MDHTNWRSLLLSWDGRLRRSHFWVGVILIGVAQALLGWIPLAGALVSLALVLPGASISVRRLHDMGHTGWLASAPVAGMAMLSVVGLVVGAFSASSALGGSIPAAGALLLAGPMFLVASMIALLNLAFILWLGLAPGRSGDNRFGTDPRRAL